MMRVHVYATLRRIVGDGRVELPAAPNDTVGAVLGRLLDAYPALRPLILDEAGELLPYVNVFLNGRMVEFLDGLDTAVQDEDELDVFPPIAGGGRRPVLLRP